MAEEQRDLFDWKSTETELLKQAAIFKEFFPALQKNKAFELWQQLMISQIETRMQILTTPLADVANSQGMDAATRAMRMEVVKGAVIGLRLALTTIPQTIAQADDLLNKRAQAEEQKGSAPQSQEGKAP